MRSRRHTFNNQEEITMEFKMEKSTVLEYAQKKVVQPVQDLEGKS